MKFRNILIFKIFLVLFCTFGAEELQARDRFRFDLGNEIHVISDKALRATSENTFEAIGNVIIKFGSNSIYSEKAKISFDTGSIEVEGNVRYVSTNLTMYGTHLKYNTKTQTFKILNARVLSDNFVLLGKELVKYGDNRITGKDAEYTTCKDCPESWSVYGKDIEITIGEYVRIKHSYLKAKGVVMMYIPYIIFPIKNKRESGVLFPRTSFNFADGVMFQLPLYWAISDNKDLTFTPSMWGNRGLGGVLEYRHYINERDWFEATTLFANDEVYEPYKSGFGLSGDTEFRYYTEYEHHFSSGLFFNHHLNLDILKDKDMIRDYDFYTQQRVDGSELGGEGFFDFRTGFFNFSIDSDYKRNLLDDDPYTFDNSLVQILPRASFSSLPINLINTSYFGLNSISFGWDSDYTIFKQNRIDETSGNIRNAHRININPYVNWNLGNLGGFNINSLTTVDYQNYHFPTLTEDKSFYKQALIHKTSAAIEFERLFGVAYREMVPEEDVEGVEKKKKEENPYGMVGNLPSYNRSNTKKEIEVIKNSYRHSQIFQLNHYLLSSLENGGNRQFANQIESESGQFDIIDSYRDQEFRNSQVNSQTSIPLRNTLEFQWRNSLVEKRARVFDYNVDNRYLKQNFEYRKIAFLNISQGYNLDVISDNLEDKLTRFYAEAGYNIDNFSISGSQYYFYKDQRNVFRLNVSRSDNLSSVSVGFTYDSLVIPINRLLDVQGRINLFNYANVYAQFMYDLEAQLETRSLYGIEYTPTNDCWRVDVNYSQGEIEDRISVNFMIKFNDNNFSSLSGI